MPKREKFLEEITPDLLRPQRCGFPEFIYGKEKTFEQIKKAIQFISSANQAVLVTKLDEKIGKKLQKAFPKGNYDSLASCFYIKPPQKRIHPHTVSIITAGTTDLPIAHEARCTLEACSYQAKIIADVGVAGIHRLFKRIEEIRRSSLLIVIAGMEGALPSVIGGLVSCPVIAVPTSIGYGASFNGVAALLAMLNSCANGITVVNIDNGFGAACAAIRILNTFGANFTR